MKHYAAALENEPLIVQFSGGKDSICMLDLLSKFHKKGKLVVVFLYFVDGLSFKESILKYYENKYKIKIEREPSPRTLTLETGKKWKMSDVEAYLRKKYDITFIAQGIKKTDSFPRRGMLAHIENGIDYRNYKFYPIADMNDREVIAYIKLNKLMLPHEYSVGMERDVWVPDGEKLMWIKHTFPSDYDKIIKKFPLMEEISKHEELYGCK